MFNDHFWKLELGNTFLEVGKVQFYVHFYRKVQFYAPDCLMTFCDVFIMKTVSAYKGN